MKQFQGASLVQTQTQKLSPQMLQAVNLMTLPAHELIGTIGKELEENPFLEVKDKTVEPQTSSDNIESADVNSREESSDTDYKYTSSEISVNEFIEATVYEKPSLKEHLIEELKLETIDSTTYEICESLIYNLNSKGFHQESPYSLLKDTSKEEIDRCIDIVNRLEPIGLCVNDIIESLLVQSKIMGRYPEYTLDLLGDNRELLLTNNKNKIAQHYNIDLDDVEEIFEYIGILNPHPAANFSDIDNYITPEAEIHKEGAEIVVTLRDDTIPSLAITTPEEELRGTKESKAFVSERLASARNLLSAIDLRNSTLLKTLKSIVQHQREFFLLGPGNIKPLTRKEIAAETELSESTISRISSNKYVQTDWGIFQIAYFFSNAVKSSNTGQAHSKESVKEVIKSIINENKSQKKLSDQKISNILKERGISIARRTVSKYRKELNLLSSFDR